MAIVFDEVSADVQPPGTSDVGPESGATRERPAESLDVREQLRRLEMRNARLRAD